MTFNHENGFIQQNFIQCKIKLVNQKITINPMRIPILSFVNTLFKTLAAFLSILLSIAVLLFIDGFLSLPAFSSSNLSSLPNVKEETAWHISALKVSYDNERQIYVAEGEVIILGVKKKLKSETETTQPSESPQKSGEIRLEADYVEFSNRTRDAEAFGRVLLVSGKDNITCDHLTFNVETEVGTIYNGVVFIDENHFYIKGDTIEKTGKDTYRSERASITSCDGDNPDWRLSGKDIKVTIDGYGTAKSATFWTGKIPALYSPIVLFPAKTKRQTGLLIPRVSSSDKKGFEVEQPLFVAISRSTDATFYTDYMSKRGVKTGLEYRYVLSESSSTSSTLNNYGTLFYDYLNDSRFDNGDSNAAKGDFASTTSQGNIDRYWFRMKNSHTFDNTWSAKLDIDYVSDSDYLREFRDGFTGFDSVSRYFRDTFGRSIDEYDDTTRENSLNINRTWSSAALNIGAQWFDNVEARESGSKNISNINNSVDGKDTTLQKLPYVEFNTIKKQVGKSRFYYDLDSEYRYFYRQNTYSYSALSHFYNQQNMGDSLNPAFARFDSLLAGHRTDIYPRVYMPLKLGAFYIEPSAGLRQSLWYVNGSDDGDGVDSGNLTTDMSTIADDNVNITSDFNQTEFKSFSHREAVDLNVELSTKLSKVFNIGTKHTDNKNAERKKNSSKFAGSNIKYERNNGKFIDSNDRYEGNNGKFSEKIKHEIIPKIEYSFIPELNQDNLPYFDELDYIEERNRITWSFGNRLIHRNENKIYNEFAWFEISQSYRIDETELEITSSESQLSRLDSLELEQTDSEIRLNSVEPFKSDEPSFKYSKSFSDISARVEFSPSPFFSLNNDAKWSPYDNRFSSNDSGVAIKDTRGDVLEAWYRYDEADYESIFASLNTKITDTLNIFFICEYSFSDNKNIESHTGFYLNKSCWSMRLSYSDTPEDRSMSLMVNLHGIGEFGK
ncbi:MAG: LPS assembly protein LptD [Desulfamplus sp.]|nr:LPS assembly protein LptD [Desulfamplus sp.]